MNKPLPDDTPFEINRVDDQRVIIRFAEIVDHNLFPERVNLLRDTVKSTDQVVCDLTETDIMVGRWIRLLDDLGVVVAGMTNVQKEVATIMRVGGKLKHVRTVEEGWRKQ